MKRMFEFECDEGHRSEAFVEHDAKFVQCPHCDLLAHRVISAPSIKLDGVSGHFPSEWDRWARKHEEATKVARKKARDHGPTSMPGIKNN